jgi:hypothetical protein
MDALWSGSLDPDLDLDLDPHCDKRQCSKLQLQNFLEINKKL